MQLDGSFASAQMIDELSGPAANDRGPEVSKKRREMYFENLWVIKVSRLSLECGLKIYLGFSPENHTYQQLVKTSICLVTNRPYGPTSAMVLRFVRSL